VQNTTVRNLTRLAPFTRDSLGVGGCPDCVNATKAHNGPSWRMVVAPHPDPKRFRAYGIYPGGQSGNPGSPYYDNFVKTWASGELDELLFLRAAKRRKGVVSVTRLQPEE
ncbi:MAG: penicillin acylase family protein, partial [Bacteroidota bacterium]